MGRAVQLKIGWMDRWEKSCIIEEDWAKADGGSLGEHKKGKSQARSASGEAEWKDARRNPETKQGTKASISGRGANVD